MARSVRFAMLLSDDERGTLRELSRTRGISCADILRMLISEEADRSGLRVAWGRPQSGSTDAARGVDR